jgi:23S rRNA pseudouridine1911/1915/1917 synthase
VTEVLLIRAALEDKGARVDLVVARRHPELSRSRVQALIEAGHVLLGDKPVKSSHRLVGTEELRVEVPAPVAAIPEAQELPLQIVHEDKHLLVLDKAAGMVVHPGAGHADGTVVNALLHHVKDLRGVGGELRPGIVHRLDKDTSGLLVIAKHDVALRALQAAFKSRQVEKTYVALVLGHPPESGTFRTLHGRHPTQRLKFTGKAKTGKPAVTHFTVKRAFAQASEVEIDLETGRTHQIRVHFAEAGFPLLSDPLYGTKRAQRPDVIGRLALHAHRLAFVHPVTKKKLSFTAPLPKDLRDAVKRLGSEHADRD